MNEKCDSHDDCFKRLYTKMEKVLEKLDLMSDDIRDQLHAGDVRFTKIEMRLDEIEKSLSKRSSGHSDVKQKLIASAIDILKLAVIGIGSAAAWAFANGYKG